MRYKGVDFDTELEARYAVFFYHLGIEWEYKTRRVYLPTFRNGEWYTPSFWFPGLQMFGDVKEVSLFVDYERMLQASGIMKTDGIVLHGMPESAIYSVASFVDGNDEEYKMRFIKYGIDIGPTENDEGFPEDESAFYDVILAASAARQARF